MNYLLMNDQKIDWSMNERWMNIWLMDEHVIDEWMIDEWMDRSMNDQW
jgi:hypothetical protein